MSAEFIDSNIFVYLFDEKDARKRRAAETLVSQQLETGQGVISVQVVQETLNVLTRKLATPVTPSDARRFFDEVLAPLWRVMPSAALYHRCLEIQAQLRYSFFDSLIIAAALDADCTCLYSEDLQHGQRIGALTIVNPFRA
jgi:predicted nucleic acid-binding protein